MKLSNTFPLLVTIFFIFQEQRFILSLNVPGSPGYYQDGDFIIGGFFSLRVTDGDTRSTFGFQDTYSMPHYVHAELTKHYQQLLAVVFAVNEINKKLNLLFNMSLGFYLFNVDYVEMKAVESSLSLLSGESPLVPNYNFRPEKRDKLVAVIGGISTQISTQISRVLCLYSVPQISYGPFDRSLRDSVQLQSTYQFPTNTAALFQGFIELLLHFGWVWVGLVVPDDIRGEMFLQDMTEEMNSNGLCVAFAAKVPEFPAKDTLNRELFFERFTSTSIIVAFGDTYSLLRFVYLIYCNNPFGNIWVTTTDWDITTLPFEQSLSYTYFGGGLSFSFHTEEIPGFKEFLRTIQPAKYPNDIFIQDVWSTLFECPYLDQHGIKTLSQFEQNGILETQALHVWDMNTSPQSYTVHAAVSVIARALHKILSLNMKEQPLDKAACVTPHPWQLHPFFGIQQKTGHETILPNKLDIFNYQSLLNGTKALAKVGEFIFDSLRKSLAETSYLCAATESCYCSRFPLLIPLVQIPSAVCTPSCPDGFRKKIANKTDMDQCVKCSEDRYPNTEGNQCLPKLMTFLSYEDTLGAALASTAITNNRNLSYVLLISLILCFFCSLMFIGLPSPVTCILRQTFFGVVFSIAVSAILAKTFIVLVAFKSIKPGNSVPMWMVTRFSNVIVCSCSLTQVCICTVWLTTSPPFPDTDTQSEFGQIILQCNEGSTVAFYCVLGYLGFLAFLSLVLAFLARTLPDRFNESKMITFSMLVFCSVWISFIPSYISTKGKTMVALEIFAILSSSAGLLGCIFLPKCYVILLRSDNASRK
uniref:G-protein coupled receptors family 3 profile domain-containing protein n=1 Tax=Cavia porcellus TaxID=10141 RepID=H0VW99_CAVPO